jgi:hypothetical protein
MKPAHTSAKTVAHRLNTCETRGAPSKPAKTFANPQKPRRNPETGCMVFQSFNNGCKPDFYQLPVFAEVCEPLRFSDNPVRYWFAPIEMVTKPIFT